MEEIANALQECIDLLKKFPDNEKYYKFCKRPGKVATLKHMLKARIDAIPDEEFFEKDCCDNICQCDKWYESGQIFPLECCKTCTWFNKPRYEELLEAYNRAIQFEFDFGDNNE